MNKQLELVRALIKSDTPVLIWGPPGTGKTATLLALAKEEDAHAEVLIGSTMDPTDVGGYLVPDSNGIVRSSPPPWARRLAQALAQGKNAWLILDELSCAPPSVQAALLRVVHDRMVGDIDLRGARVVAAANPADTAADGGSLSAATANRWAHINWSVDAKSWTVGELSGWGQNSVSGSVAAARASICGWISHKPTALLNVPEGAAAERGWPSPRSWSAAARALACSPKDLELACVAACVGDGAAAEWQTWRVNLDLPNPEDVLSGKAKVPVRGDKAFAVLAGVVAAAGSDHPQRDSRVRRAWQILSTQRPDVALTPASALLDMTGGEVPDEARELGQRIIGAGA